MTCTAQAIQGSKEWTVRSTSSGRFGTSTTTVLEGELPDQGALLGVLNTLYELHLPLEAFEARLPGLVGLQELDRGGPPRSSLPHPAAAK